MPELIGLALRINAPKFYIPPDDNLSIMADIGVVELLLNAIKNHIKVCIRSTYTIGSV